jgi:DNA mismatch endonuclease, patch repair protein
MVVRSLLSKMGYRFRVHRKDLPGRPDVVFVSKRKAIFIHGCFWHTHHCRYGNVIPATNAEFWQKKRSSNVERDKRNQQMLTAAGWKTLTLWECCTSEKESLKQILTHFLENEA